MLMLLLAALAGDLILLPSLLLGPLGKLFVHRDASRSSPPRMEAIPDGGPKKPHCKKPVENRVRS
jgi:hypothetical protein